MDLELDNLAAFRVLGRGAMGTVFLVTDRSPDRASPSPHLFALKVVEKSPSSSPVRPDADRRARWEVSVLSRLSHPFLPCLLGRLETPDFLAWAVPYCPGGDLNALRYSQTDRVFSPSAIRFYLSEIVLALAHLHALGIVYRDLKPENVLVQASGHVTLTDFDLSRYLSPRSPATAAAAPPPEGPRVPEKAKRHCRNLTRLFSAAAEERKLTKKARSARVSPVSRRRTSVAGGERSNSFVGTEEYVAPEVVRGDGHEFAVDWWALGILTYEMTYGRTPFRGRNRKETFRNVLTRQPEFVGRQQSDLTDLIGRLLAKEPTRRLGFNGGAEEVKAHPFFLRVQWDLLTEVNRPPFISPCDEEEEMTAVLTGGDGISRWGFDVRDYFKKLRQQQATSLMSPLASPLAASVSLAEF